MSKILVTGLVNTETVAPVRGFPVNYYPIDYTFGGVKTAPGGVGFNVAAALARLGDEAKIATYVGRDFSGKIIAQELRDRDVDTEFLRVTVGETAGSVALYAPDGRRQIYCDLKNLQDLSYPADDELLSGVDLAVCCNINFARPVLRLAREKDIPVATDVHVLSDVNDGYNREFIENADLLFLSDEGISGDKGDFLRALSRVSPARIIVLGMGGDGALMLSEGRLSRHPAEKLGAVVNTLGAGDALFAAFAHFWAKGLPPEDCLRRAQIFAALKIQHSGASAGFVPESEIEKYL